MRDDLLRVISRLDVRTILDAGCGSGDALALLAGTGRYQLCGADLSPEALALAGKRTPGVRLELLDLERAALPQTFDLVMSVQVVEHLIDDVAAIRHLAEMSAGYVYTSTIAGRMRPSERSGSVTFATTARSSCARSSNSPASRSSGCAAGVSRSTRPSTAVAERLPGGPPIGRSARRRTRRESPLPAVQAERARPRRRDQRPRGARVGSLAESGDATTDHTWSARAALRGLGRDPVPQRGGEHPRVRRRAGRCSRERDLRRGDRRRQRLGGRQRRARARGGRDGRRRAAARLRPGLPGRLRRRRAATTS